MTVPLITAEAVRSARENIREHIRHTPCWYSEPLSQALDRETFVKLENLQISGCFKIRGVLNRLMNIPPEDAKRGVTTVSGGNHAIAVAIAGRMLDLPVFVAMPKSAPASNIRAAKSCGAEIFLADTVGEAFKHAQHKSEEGRTFVHPYDDPEIIEGHGTLGLEVAESCSPTHVFVSVGGGGFLAGVGVALKAALPEVQIIGTEPEGALTMTKALAAGHPITIEPSSVISTLAAPFATDRTLAHAKSLCQEIVAVSDDEAFDAAWQLTLSEKIVCEPAAGCTLAAARKRCGSIPASSRVCLVICGGNTEPEKPLAIPG